MPPIQVSLTGTLPKLFGTSFLVLFAMPLMAVSLAWVVVNHCSGSNLTPLQMLFPLVSHLR